MRFAFAALAAALIVPGLQAEKKLKFEQLPAAVQTAAKEQTKGATIVGVSKETEKGKTTFEVETKMNGKGRDLAFDKTGALLVSEDEVDLDSLPAAAKAAIQKRAAGGTVAKVEKVTAGSTISYEAAIRTKAGKNTEFGVNADGTPHKE
jgi:uncharacterized membrane protein YkoI